MSLDIINRENTGIARVRVKQIEVKANWDEGLASRVDDPPGSGAFPSAGNPYEIQSLQYLVDWQNIDYSY